LPPIQGIEHQIDFMPRASIINWLEVIPRRLRRFKGKWKSWCWKSTFEKVWIFVQFQYYLFLKRKILGVYSLIVKPLTTLW
jgi:hypothetical protein